MQGSASKVPLRQASLQELELYTRDPTIGSALERDVTHSEIIGSIHDNLATLLGPISYTACLGSIATSAAIMLI